MRGSGLVPREKKEQPYAPSSLAKQSKTHILKQAQHLIICRIIRDKKPQIRIIQHRRNPNQPRPPPGNNTHILPAIQTLLPLPMMHIIQIRNRRSQALDPGRGTVFAPRRADVDLVRALKGADDVVVDFGGALAEVRPLVGLVGEAVLVGALGAPDDSG